MSRKDSSPPASRGLLLWIGLSIAVLGVAGACLALRGAQTDAAPLVSPQERFLKAREAFTCQNYSHALEWVEPLIREGRTSVDEQLFYGQILIELGQLAKARTLFNTLHRESPSRVEVVVGLGQVHERSGEGDLAIACYKRACDMKKTDGRMFRLLGLAQEASGDRMAALFSFRQSLRLLPGQEDLSRRMNEIGALRQARMDPSQARRGRQVDPFDDPSSGPSDPQEMIRRTMPADPFQGIPRPGQVNR